MCGIAGIFAYHYAANPVDRDELLRIRERMTARGPDGAGSWFAEGGRIGLVHRRLSIIDLSDRAAQPFVSADGRYVITFNGEIYNYRDLRAELEQRGIRFRSGSDTEVLLQMFIQDGPAMLSRLRGMFAFAVWDTQARRLFLARDPYGIKPLYYADDGWTCRFASQVKALLAGGRISRSHEPAAIAGFYLFGSVPEPYTWLEDVRAVPAGHYLWVTDLGAREPQQYFSIAQVWAGTAKNGGHGPPCNGSVGRAVPANSSVRAALLASVRHHLVSDVPVGLFLSAGVDSGALLGLMRDGGQNGIQAITLGFEEFKNKREDEVPLAETTARHYGAQHSVRRVSESEFHADLPRILDAMDQPSGDGLNTWFVAKAAIESGLKVALSGLGGDELFGGYPSFRDIPRWVRLLRVPALVPGAGRLYRELLGPLADRVPPYSPKFAGMLEFGGTYAGAYLLRRGLFMPWELPRLMGADQAAAGLQRLIPLELIQAALPRKSSPPFARVAAMEASLYMRNQLLRDADWAGMAHSLEIRTPLVDAQLLNALAPPLAQTNGRLGKRPLAQAPEKPLPAVIVSRAKTGFTTPIGDWLLKSPLDSWQRLPQLAHPRSHWSRRWAYSVMNSGAF